MIGVRTARVAVLGTGGAARAVRDGAVALGHHLVEADTADVTVLCGPTAERIPPGSVVANTGAAPCESTVELMRYRPDLTWVSHPRELDETSGPEDFLAPRVLVAGSACADAADRVLALHPDAIPRVRTDTATADLLADARNGFFALRRHHAALLDELCAAVGADPDDVAACLGRDPRLADPRAPVPRGEGELRRSLERLAAAAEPGGGARSLLAGIDGAGRLREDRLQAGHLRHSWEATS